MAFILGGILGAPWVPAFRRDLDTIVKDIPFKKGSVVTDLGCGDGRFVIAAAKKGCYAIGYEINIFLWLVAYIRALPYPNAHIRLANLWHQDMSQTDVIFIYLMPRFMARLERKIEQQAKPGCLVITYIFALPQRKVTHSIAHAYFYEY